MLFYIVFQGASVVGGQDADKRGVIEDEGGDGEEGEDGVRPDTAQRSDKVRHTPCSYDIYHSWLNICD